MSAVIDYSDDSDFTPQFQKGADRAHCPGCGTTHGGWTRGNAPDLWRCEYCSHQQHDDQMVDLRTQAKTASKLAALNVRRFERSQAAPHDGRLEALEADIRAEFDLADQRAAEAVQHVINAGRKLIEVRTLTAGNWERWQQANYGGSQSTVLNAIHAAEFVAAHPDFDIHALGRSALYRLAGPQTPEAAVDAVQGQIEAGQSVTVEGVIDTVRREKARAFIQEKAPVFIKERVASGDLALIPASNIVRELDKAPAEIATLAEKYGLNDYRLIPVLSRLQKQGSATYKTIAATGYLQGSKVIALRDANIRDLNELLEEARLEHVFGGVPPRLVDAVVHLKKASGNEITLVGDSGTIKALNEAAQGSAISVRILVNEERHANR